MCGDRYCRFRVIAAMGETWCYGFAESSYFTANVNEALKTVSKSGYEEGIVGAYYGRVREV